MIKFVDVDMLKLVVSVVIGGEVNEWIIWCVYWWVLWEFRVGELRVFRNLVVGFSFWVCG